MTNRRIAEMVLESAIDYAIITADLSGNVTSWSIGAQKVFGWTEDEVLGLAADIISQATTVRTMFPAKKWQMRCKTAGRQMSVGMYARMAPGFGQAVKCCDFMMTVLQKASSRSFETERSKSGRRSCSRC